MIVVSNTSPITNLAAVGQLDLLRQLYEKILIPRAVYEELTSGGGRQPGAAEVQTLAWIETRAVKDRALVAAQKNLLAGDDDIVEREVEDIRSQTPRRVRDVRAPGRDTITHLVGRRDDLRVQGKLSC